MTVRWPLCAGFNTAYASWPFRFWVLTEDRVAFKPMPQDSAYDIRELDSFLQSVTPTEPPILLDTP